MARYQSELGRPADAAGLANVTSFLANGGSLAQVQQGIASSPEAQAAINRLYLAELGRGSDSGGVVSFTQYLAGGGLLTGVAASLAGSPEAQAQIGPLYQNVLDRMPLPAEQAAATQYLAGGGSLSGLRGGLATSNEAANLIHAAYVAAGRLSPDATPNSVQIDAGESELLSGVALTALQREIADDVRGGQALVPVNIRVSPVTPAMLSGNTPTFIYSLGTSDALIATQPEQVSFEYTYFGELKSLVGHATITGFNPATDILQISSQQANSVSDLTISAMNSPGRVGTSIFTTGAGIDLLNVAPGSLHASNFLFV